MSRPCKEKICPTCRHRLPEIPDLMRRDTRPHRIPVEGCWRNNNVDSVEECGDYRNIWTGRKGLIGNPPNHRPRI